MDKITENRKHIETLLDRTGEPSLYVGNVSSILRYAANQGVTELLISRSDMETIRVFMANNGAWNWDEKSFWKMKLTVINNG